MYYHCPEVTIFLRVLGLPLVNSSDPVRCRLIESDVKGSKCSLNDVTVGPKCKPADLPGTHLKVWVWGRTRGSSDCLMCAMLHCVFFCPLYIYCAVISAFLWQKSKPAENIYAKYLLVPASQTVTVSNGIFSVYRALQTFNSISLFTVFSHFSDIVSPIREINEKRNWK